MSSPAPSTDSNQTLPQAATSPSVDTSDAQGRAQPWRDLLPDRYWAEPRSFQGAANKGPRLDIRLLPEIDAISR